MKAEERGLAGQFQGFYPADARDLGIFADEQFDASLMMGPLYHLQAEEDRHAAVQELFRVTKRGGIVFVAVMTVVRHVMNSLLHPQHWKPNDSIGQIRGFMETGIFNHQDEGGSPARIISGWRRWPRSWKRTASRRYSSSVLQALPGR